MIKPFTLICMASAFGAGLYLYQSKHTAQMLDREIARTIKQTEATRDRTVQQKASWALLNEPDRLADLAKAHLTLSTLKPTQFAALSDLGSRLPGPVAAHPERLPVEAEPEEPPAPVAQAAPVAAAVAAPVAAPGAIPVVVPGVAAMASASKPKVAAVVEAKPTKVDRAAVDKVVVEKAPVDRAQLEKAQVEKAWARAEPSRPSEPAATAVRARVPALPQTVASGGDNTGATAPGTVGAAVLRAMRAQEHATPAAAPERVAAVPAYTPRVYAAPVSTQPAYVKPSYAQPGYAQPGYAQPGYAQPGASVLGEHPALPAPVPFAAR